VADGTTGIICLLILELTKSPASLNQGNLGVVDQEGDGSPEIVRFRPEIGVKNGYVLAVFDVASLEPFFESAGFVARPVLSDLVRYVDALACPSLAFRLNHLLHYHDVMRKMKQISSSRTQIRNFIL